MNYAIAYRRNDAALQAMNTNDYVGLTIGGINFLGSTASRLYDWITGKYPNAFTVSQVKVEKTKAHWGGAINWATGGERHRESIKPNPDYFKTPHRFLLREFSVAYVAGHFVIQTDDDEFWDPKDPVKTLPKTMFQLMGDYPVISERADALQIDVNA